LADERAKRFVSYKWVILKRHLPEQEKDIRSSSDEAKNAFFNRKQLILQRVDEFKTEYNLKSDRALLTWSGQTLKDMAKRISKELLNEYESAFRLSSRFSHPGILGDKEYLIQDEKKLVFSPEPTDIGIILNMKRTINYYLEFLFMTNGLFDLKYEDQLNDIKLKCDNVFRMDKYLLEEVPSSKTAGKPSGIKESVIVFKLKT